MYRAILASTCVTTLTHFSKIIMRTPIHYLYLQLSLNKAAYPCSTRSACYNVVILTVVVVYIYIYIYKCFLFDNIKNMQIFMQRKVEKKEAFFTIKISFGISKSRYSKTVPIGCI